MKTQLCWLPSILLTAIVCGLLNADLALNAVAAETPVKDKTEMLAKHHTVAQFTGITPHRCMGRTSLCPDKCGSSGDMASFDIVKYLAYEKPGKYGDAQAKKYQFLVQDNLGNLKVSAETKVAVDALKPGDYVVLDWQHNYVTKNRSSFPERVITQLKKVTKEEADKLEPGPNPPAAE